MSRTTRLAALLLLGACSAGTEPQPSPIATRELGGESTQPGVKVIVCAADDAGCVPSYAVACPASSDSTLPGLPLAPGEQTWCAAQPRADSLRPR